MDSNYRNFLNSYIEELAMLSLKGPAPCVRVRRDNGMNCLIPVRLRLVTGNGQAEPICQHEVTITVQTKGEGVETLAPEGKATADIKPRLKVVGLGQASASLIKLSGDSAPVSCNVGQRLTEYDGEEIPRRVAEELMNNLHWAAVSRAVEN